MLRQDLDVACSLGLSQHHLHLVGAQLCGGRGGAQAHRGLASGDLIFMAICDLDTAYRVVLSQHDPCQLWILFRGGDGKRETEPRPESNSVSCHWMLS